MTRIVWFSITKLKTIITDSVFSRKSLTEVANEEQEKPPKLAKCQQKEGNQEPDEVAVVSLADAVVYEWAMMVEDLHTVSALLAMGAPQWAHDFARFAYFFFRYLLRLILFALATVRTSACSFDEDFRDEF